MGRTNLRPIQKTNLREHIIERLRDVILDGTYAPGDRLVEMAIADQLQVSRAPVREALSALEQEGVVVQVTRRGYFVAEFSEKDITEVYSLRLLLEIEALRRASDHATKDDYKDLQGLVDRLARAAIEKKDPEEIVGLDLKFHECICRMADHSRLLSAWDSLRMQTRILVAVTSRTHYEQPDEPRERHQMILDAMRTKDIDRACSVMTEHVLDAQQRALHALRANNKENGDTNS